MEGLSVLKSVASSVAGMAVAGALVASPALAAGGYPIYGDGGLKDEVLYAPPPITWAGFYIGAHAGYGWADADWRARPALDDLTNGFVFSGERFSHDPKGWLGGGQIGYNFQTGRIVWGVEATLSGADINEETRLFPALLSTTRLETSIDTLWTVTGRLGYDWGRVLTYAKAGYAGADVELSARDPVEGFRVTDSNTHHGWTVGGGIEFLATENVVLGLEYNFYDFGEEDYGARFLTARPLVEADVDLHTVTARVSYKFGRRAPAIVEPLPPLK